VTITASAFTFVSELVKRQAAIVIGPGKEYLVESRLLPLARDAGLDDVGALIARLQGSHDDGLRRQIVEAMTTNETSFFRDRDPFNALSQAIVPELCKLRRASHRLTIWSAACSTGQEPYSIAMTLLDHPLITADWQVDVLATDINGDVLERARRARYSQLEVNRGLPAPLLVRHFERAETEWRVVAAVRKMVRFAALNLAEPFEVHQMDVVFLRNVLIYFDPATKVEVLRRVRAILRPDGFLFLGGAETTLGLDDCFERVGVGSTIAYRPKGAGPLDLPSRLAPAVAGMGLSGTVPLAVRPRQVAGSWQTPSPLPPLPPPQQPALRQPLN
jgi:chemotaxis protein methyltransferase CheR